MARISWTEEAQTWLEDIFEYIARESPTAAGDVVDGIYARAQVLTVHPLVGYRYETIPGREVRILLYGHYRIAYHVKSEDEVDILGVFHGSLDIDRYLY